MSGRLQGYTIPLDKRLAADGRGLQEVQINDQFAKLTEALYVAESKAREAVDMRQKVRFDLHVHIRHDLMPTFEQILAFHVANLLESCLRCLRSCDTADFVGGSLPVEVPQKMVEGVLFSTDMRPCGICNWWPDASSMQSYDARVVHGRCHRQGRKYVILQTKLSSKAEERKCNRCDTAILFLHVLRDQRLRKEAKEAELRDLAVRENRH